MISLCFGFYLSVMIYSYSQLKCFEECPLQYRFLYIDKLKDKKQIPTLSLILGSTIHNTLEYLYKTYDRKGVIISLPNLHQYFETKLTATIQDNESVSESYFSAQEITQIQQEGEQMLTDFYEQYYPFERPMHRHIEQTFYCPLPNGHKWRGIIDRREENNSSATIIDYKTDKSIQQSQTNHQEQITSYAYRIQQQSPTIQTIEGKLIYLRHSQAITWTISTHDIQTQIQQIIKRIETIEQTLFLYNMGEKEAFRPVLQSRCRSCAYQHHCPLYQAQQKNRKSL